MAAGKEGAERVKRQNIVLVGFMGTGKTTVGKLLAKHMNWCFVDTDQLVEQREGKLIPELFATRGEAYFRSVEVEVIHECMQKSCHIVATGGGSVLNKTNRERMRENGFVVALTAEADTIIRRVKHDKNRPLLHGNVEENVRKILAERRDAYHFADLTVDTTYSNFEETLQTILEAWTHRI